MIFSQISERLQKGDPKEIADLIGQVFDQGATPEQVLNQGLIAGMDRVGQKFQSGEIFIPHMLLAETGNGPAGRVVLGTVQGDHHDIGKNLVSTMLAGKGFEVIDVGIDAPPETFIAAVDDTVPIVAMSALLSTTAPFIGKTIEALDKAGLRKNLKIMVGGGAVSQRFSDEIGADAYGGDAATAAVLAMDLVGKGA
ncbi:MAG: cobalamin B12-binding domain-containing protein [Desulfobacter sp.]|nr:MAG: cobalamin B12-binding domain-containing protein [Desulfobacter sp.]